MTSPVPVYLAVIAAVSAVASLAGIDHHSLWMDEGYSLHFSANPETLTTDVRDTGGNMWLYYALLWLWRLGGSSDVWLRLLSVLWAVAGTLVATRLFARLCEERLACVAGLWLATNPLLVELAQEVRGYTLLYFLCTMVVYALLRHLEGGRIAWLLGSIGAAVAAVMTHYFAVIFLLALGFWASLEYLIERRPERLAVVVALAAASLLGLLYIASMSARAGENLSYLANWRLLMVPAYFHKIGGHGLGDPLAVLAVIPGLLAAILVAQVLHGRGGRSLSLKRLVVVWIAFPLLAFLAISELYQPIYKSRYLIWLLPAIAALVPALAGRNGKERRWMLLALAMCASNLVAITVHYGQPPQEDWRAAARIVASKSGDVDPIPVLFYVRDVHFVFDAYARRTSMLAERVIYPELCVGTVGTGSNENDRHGDPDCRTPKEISRDHRTIWLIASHVQPPPMPNLPSSVYRILGVQFDRGDVMRRPAELRRILESLGSAYQARETWSVPGISLWRLDREDTAASSAAVSRATASCSIHDRLPSTLPLGRAARTMSGTEASESSRPPRPGSNREVSGQTGARQAPLYRLPIGSSACRALERSVELRSGAIW